MGSDFAGVVLGAGLGTRLRPLTDLLPKALCPVNNVALVDLAIEHVRGATDDIAVNVHAHRAAMEAHLAARDVHVSVEETEPLGTAGALGKLRDWIAGRPTLVHNADAWFGWSRGDEIRHLLVDGWDVVPASLPEGRDFGPWRYAGACALPWRDVNQLKPEPSGLYEVCWAKAEKQGRLDFVAFDGAWFDTGTPATYLAANLAASGGESVVALDAVVEPGAQLTRSVVWPRATVGSGEHLVEQIRAPGGITVDSR
jgi:NDP-sugar pyrophosphorylase family protein